MFYKKFDYLCYLSTYGKIINIMLQNDYKKIKL